MRNGLVALAVLAAGARGALADDVTMPDGSKWNVANGAATYKNISFSDTQSVRSSTGCAKGLAVPVTGPPVYLPAGWFAREEPTGGAAVICHDNSGLITTMQMKWTGAIAPEDHGAIASALSLLAPFSESEPFTSIDLLKPSRGKILYTAETGQWRYVIIEEDRMAIQLVWPMEAPGVTNGKRFITMSRSKDPRRCSQLTLDSGLPSWASAPFQGQSSNGTNTQTCIDTPDGHVYVVAVSDGVAGEDLPYVTAMVAALGTTITGSAVGGLTLGPATGQPPAVVTPTPTPETPSTPTPEPNYVPTSPSLLKFFEVSGQILLPENQSTENGFGIAIGFRKAMNLGIQALPFFEGELGYNSVGEIFGTAMLGFTARLAPFFRLEAGVGYDGVGFGSERMTTNVVVDDNLIYGALAALEGRRATLSFGYYGRNDDVVSYELRAELDYYTGGGWMLFARLTSYQDACNIFSLGFSP